MHGLLQEIKGILSDVFRNKLAEIRSDIGDCWYLTFTDEDTAMEVLEFLRDKTFKDQPVRARIKTENAFRSLYVSLL
jgi:hypothetical protein